MACSPSHWLANYGLTVFLISDVDFILESEVPIVWEHALIFVCQYSTPCPKVSSIHASENE